MRVAIWESNDKRENNEKENNERENNENSDECHEQQPENKEDKVREQRQEKNSIYGNKQVMKEKNGTKEQSLFLQVKKNWKGT